MWEAEGCIVLFTLRISRFCLGRGVGRSLIHKELHMNFGLKNKDTKIVMKLGTIMRSVLQLVWESPSEGNKQ